LTEMFSNSGLGPNCIVMFAVESTEKTFCGMYLENPAFYHSAPERRPLPVPANDRKLARGHDFPLNFRIEGQSILHGCQLLALRIRFSVAETNKRAS
jgi:hypothetical protein